MFLIKEVTLSYGAKVLFNDISETIGPRDRIALVGSNGSGKTTLLRLLMGEESPDSGSIEKPDYATVGYLPQDGISVKGCSLREEAGKAFSDANALKAKLDEAEKELGEMEPDTEEFYDLIDLMGAWEEQLAAYEPEKMNVRIDKVFTGMGFSKEDMDRQVDEFSGGWQMRIALGKLLLQGPSLLILDEPTNHLDIDTIEWLESYLSQQNMSLILVTHDRYFLEKVTNEIFELEEGVIHRYKGDYGHFLEKKAERHENEASGISKAQNLYRKELEWIRRMPKARGTKAKNRVESFEDTKSKAFSGKSTDRLELQAKASRQGKKVLEIDSISHGFDDIELVKDFSYIFKRKDRVGIVGPNGVGKTTFLKVLTTELAPTSGEIEKGQTTKFGYYKQQELSFNEKQTVLDFAKDIAEVITLGNGSVITVSQFLTKFLFPPAVQYKPIGKLSGGEKRRLQLLEVLIQNPNFLILDEPTNDLDLITLNTLENYLDEFDGCLILVSHDRYFMDKLVEHLFVFEGDGVITDFPGNYTDFRSQLLSTPAKKKEEKKKEVVLKVVQEKKKLSFKEKRELDQLEKDIVTLEAQKAELEGKLNASSESHEDLANWSKAINSIGNDLDEKEMRWLELSEMTN